MRTTAIQSNRNRIIRHLMIQTVLTRLLLVSYALQRRQSFTYSDDFPEGKLYECTNGNCTKYIFAGSSRIASKTSSNTYYYHTDYLGSSSIITDSSGNKVEEIYYYPFGGTRLNQGTVNLKHKYTGQEEDPETGLYFYNARYYDPILGRFISADSIVQDPFDPQAFNRYSYTRNNPLIYIDPTGNWWDTYYSYGDWGGGCYWCNYDPWAGSSRRQQEAYWDYVASSSSSSSSSSKSSSTSTSTSSSTPAPTPTPAPAPASSTQIYSSKYSSNYSPAVNLPRTAEYFSESNNSIGSIYDPIRNFLDESAIRAAQQGDYFVPAVNATVRAAIDVFLPQSYYEIPLVFMGGIGKVGKSGLTRFGQIREGIRKAKDIAKSRHNIKLSNDLRMDLKPGHPGRKGHYNKVTKEQYEFPHIHDPNAPGGVRNPTSDDYIEIFKLYGE